MSDTVETLVLDDADLTRRIDAIVAKTTMSREDVIREALEHGRSLAWQEEWLRRLEEGKAAADRGEFASAQEIERVLNKYSST